MDMDDPNTSNAAVRYKITAQLPQTSEGDMFDINPVSGMINVKASRLDREVTHHLQDNTSGSQSKLSIAPRVLRPDPTRIQTGHPSG